MSRIDRVRIGPAVERYLKSDKIRKMAPGTRRHKTRTLKYLADAMGSTFTCDMRAHHVDLTLDTLRYGENFSDDLETAQQVRSEQTMNIDRANLRGFVKWLHNNHLLSRLEDPCAELTKAKDEDQLALADMILTDDQVMAGFKVAEEIHPRDRALWALGIYLCLRESEVLDLKWGNIHLDDAKPYVEFRREKQDKFHRLPLTPALVADLRAWKAWVEERHGPIQEHWFVVPSRPSVGIGKKMHAEWPIDPEARAWMLARVLKPIFEAVGVTNTHRMGVHTLRRTGACKLFEKTRDLKVVKDWLGHADIKTTMHYLRYRDGYDKLEEVAELYDPFDMAPEPVKVEAEDSNVIDIFSRKAG